MMKTSKTRRKTLTFDEENIQVTFHPKEKDYGMMKVTEANTPYPRHEDPIDATILRDRLKEQLAKSNENLTSSSSSTATLVSHTSYMSAVADNFDDIEPVTIGVPGNSLQLDLTPSVRSMTQFELHRRDFDHAEFTMAKQRALSSSLHVPLDTYEGGGMRVSEAASHIFMSLPHMQSSLMRSNHSSLMRLSH